MTRVQVTERLEKNWHLLLIAGAIVGALGWNWISPNQRISAVEAASRAMTFRVDSLTTRQDRVETAITILALKACKDTSVSGFEALTLQCATLGRR